MLIDIGAFRCNVIDEGVGRPTVWLHGLGGTWRDFEAQLDLLTDRYRVVVPEMRGHGRSAAVPGPMSTAALAADVVAVLDVLEIEKAVIGGLSLGGMVAQVLALDHQSRVEGLVLIDTTRKVPTSVSLLLRAVAGRIRSKGMPAVIDMLEKMERAAGRATGPEALAEARAQGVAWQRRDMAGNDPDVLAASILALVEHDERKRLAQMTTPAMVVVGADDPLVPVAMAEELAKAIPGASFTVIPDAGHVPNRERPDVFDDLVVSFIDKMAAG